MKSKCRGQKYNTGILILRMQDESGIHYGMAAKIRRFCRARRGQTPQGQTFVKYYYRIIRTRVISIRSIFILIAPSVIRSRSFEIQIRLKRAIG